jgi:hypothetical protein
MKKKPLKEDNMILEFQIWVSKKILSKLNRVLLKKNLFMANGHQFRMILPENGMFQSQQITNHINIKPMCNLKMIQSVVQVDAKLH